MAFPHGWRGSFMKKNGLLRFYLFFLLMSLALFSCENQDLTQDSQSNQPAFERKPENRHPVEPNDSPGEVTKGKKIRRKFTARSRNWC